MTDNSKSVSLSGTMKARLRKYGNLEIELCNCSSPNKLILTAFEAKGLGELLAPQAASGEARCKFCQQLPNMEGDCRCDLDPPQAASDSVTISRDCGVALLATRGAINSQVGITNAKDSYYTELEQSLEANPMQVTGGQCESR
jgi:hypothetical protein